MIPPPPVRRRFQLLESEGMNFKIDIGLRAAVEVERQAHRWTEFVLEGRNGYVCQSSCPGYLK